uniref:Uncharacterized protein n=1 Tax=Pararge aegeria TaxID=116150 RepID=S4PT43_9NEOP
MRNRVSERRGRDYSLPPLGRKYLNGNIRNTYQRTKNGPKCHKTMVHLATLSGGNRTQRKCAANVIPLRNRI